MTTGKKSLNYANKSFEVHFDTTPNLIIGRHLPFFYRNPKQGNNFVKRFIMLSIQSSKPTFSLNHDHITTLRI